MPHPLLRDPFVAAEIEAAVACYAGLLGAEDLAWMKDQLAALLDEDPEGRIMLRQAHPTGIQQSGERTRIGTEADEQATDKQAG